MGCSRVAGEYIPTAKTVWLRIFTWIMALNLLIRQKDYTGQTLKEVISLDNINKWTRKPYYILLIAKKEVADMNIEKIRSNF